MSTGLSATVDLLNGEIMKKTSVIKIIALAAAAVILAVFSAACDTPATPGDPTAAPDPTPSAKKDYKYVEVSGTAITANVTAGELLDKLAAVGIEPLSVDEAESCMFDGKDVTYHFAFGDVFAFPQKSGESVRENIVDEIYVTAEDVAAMGGIKVGDNEARVKEVFGDSCFTDGARLVYSDSGSIENKDTEPCIYFYIEDGAVSGIGLLANLYHVSA